MNSTSQKLLCYQWTGKGADGKLRQGEIQALTPNLARYYLSQQGITPEKIVQKSRVIFSGFKQGKISESMIIAFLHQLSLLINSGIPILQSFEILAASQIHSRFKEIILECKKEIALGKTLSQSLRKFPTYFDVLVCHLIFLGEQSGTLERTLQTIANYKEKSLALKKQISKALFYPSIVFGIAFLISLLMLLLIVPRFEELFTNMHSTLPGFTRVVIHFSHWIKDYYWVTLLFGIIFLSIGFYLKKLNRLKSWFDFILLKTPILKHFIEKTILARFARHFGTLFAAGIPIVEALKILAPIMNNTLYTNVIQQIQQEITQGRQLHLALQKQSIFPPLMIQMIKIGEESGSLEKILFKLAEQYESETEHWVSNLSQLLEPLIMVILGVLIGGLVIAIYLPIFKLGNII